VCGLVCLVSHAESESQKTKFELYQREFEGEMITTNKKLFNAGRVKNAFKCFSILTLIYTKRILKLNKRKVLNLLSEFSNNSFSQFFIHLCEAFLAAYIPLWKLSNPTLRNFIECKVPDESTARKNHVYQCYDLTLENVRDKIQYNFFAGINPRNARL
jgi:hypothetical protein